MEPTMSLAFVQTWQKDGIPSTTETVAGKLFLGDSVINRLTGDVYEILTLNFVEYGVYNNLTYQLRVTNMNIGSMSIAQPRARIQLNSPDFNTVYQPSINNDTEVNIILGFSSDLSLDCDISVLTSENGTDNWQTDLEVKRQFTLASNLRDSLTLTVPVGSYFKIIQVGSGGSIISIRYLQK